GDALHLNFEFPDAAFYGDDYPVTITLENVSDTTLYDLHHMIQVEQGMQIYYSDGSVKEKISVSDYQTLGVGEFNPGDKLIIEASVNIFFNSEIMQNMLQSWIDVVDGVEQLIQAVKLVKTVVEVATSVYGCVNGCIGAIDEFVESAGKMTDEIKMLAKLSKNLLELKEACEGESENALQAADDFASSGLGAALELIASDPGRYLSDGFGYR
ncbi:MAG: hypothetical protein IIW87_02355, partial [Alistipes sp.]|nr:hypothetical protein [Alistipes sp.]